MSFSSDGHFFTCGADGPEIYIWKESPTGYIVHRKLVTSRDVSDEAFPTQSFSTDGQSIVTIGRTRLQLWHTTDPSPSASSVPTRGRWNAESFDIKFSLDGLLAVTARLWDNTATVLDLKSGATRLTIDTGTAICALGVAGNTVAIAGDGKVTAWNLPTGVHALGVRADSNDSVRATRLDRLVPFGLSRDNPEFVYMSPDLNYVAVTGRFWSIDRDNCDIYDTSTGIHLGRVRSQNGGPSWFTPDGREFWAPREDSKEFEGWVIVRNSESDVARLEPLGPTVGPSGGPPLGILP